MLKFISYEEKWIHWSDIPVPANISVIGHDIMVAYTKSYLYIPV